MGGRDWGRDLFQARVFVEACGKAIFARLEKTNEITNVSIRKSHLPKQDLRLWNILVCMKRFLDLFPKVQEFIAEADKTRNRHAVYNAGGFKIYDEKLVGVHCKQVELGRLSTGCYVFMIVYPLISELKQKRKRHIVERLVNQTS